MQPKYKPLLPAYQARNVTTTHTFTRPTVNRPKRTVIKTACNRCRTKKIKCDGLRPTCTPCQQIAGECIFEETAGTVIKQEHERLQERSKDLLELYSMLRSASDEAALDMLAQLRTADDPSAALSLLRGDGGDGGSSSSSALPRQPSVVRTLRACAPPTQTSLEFELMVRHPIAYPALVPLDARGIFIPEGSADETVGRKRRRYSPAGPHSPGSSIQAQGPKKYAKMAASLAVEQDGAGRNARPSQANAFCDSRLHGLKIAYWTKVPITDDFAARAISTYLESVHPILGFFDADLFLTDLVSRGSTFCSRLLVSSFLFYACQCYTAFDITASSFSRKFFDEAQRIWNEKRYEDSPMLISSGLFLHIGCLCYGNENLSVEFILEASAAGNRMELFSTNQDSSSLSTTDIECVKRTRAKSHVAWGLFNWLTLCAFHFHKPPQLVSPPSLQIPGTCFSSGFDQPKLPTTQTFQALCGLWTIVYDMTAAYYADIDISPVAERIPLSFAEWIYQRLLAFIQGLDITMARGDQSKDHSIIFHIYYHCTVLDVFQPFLHKAGASNPTMLSIFSSPASRPDAAYAASMRQLERLILIYRSKFESARYNSFWHVALLFVYTDMVGNASKAEWAFFFDICMESFRALIVPYRLFQGVVQGLLAVALRKDAVTSAQCQALMSKLQEVGKHHTFADEMKLAGTLYVDPWGEECPEAKVDSLVKEFDDRVLFDEFIVHNDVTE